MPDPLDDLLKSDGPITQEQIRQLRKSGFALLAKADTMRKLALSRLEMAESLCDHPNKTGYICPDCGYDTSPDPY